MSNVKPIGKEGITPESLLEFLKEDIGNYRSIFVVCFTKEHGDTHQYCSGDIKEMAFAGCVLQEHALKASVI